MNEAGIRSLSRSLVAVALAVGATVSCTTTPPQPSPSPSPATAAFSGDTLRIVMPVDGVFGNFSDPSGDPASLDPHRDWPAPSDTMELYRCCLARTLLSTNGRSVDHGGSRLQADVAASLPEISSDGLTWTFRLKRGLHYAPPLADVEITAQDFIRSLHRLMAPDWSDEYAPGLYEDIVGSAEYRAGAASSISGLSSPDPHTLVIRLNEPNGDLAARLATLVIPIPASPINPQAPFGIADGHDGGFGGFAVSSGPYMIEGSPDLDFSKPPQQQTPPVGFMPGQRVTLVPNPSWDAATDPLRLALPARIEVEVVPTPEDAIERVNAGTADLLVNADIEDEVFEAARADPSLGRVFVYESGTLLGITMKTAMAPFDDIHVRRAVNHAINKAAALDVIGSSLHHRVAHHIAPDSMEDNLLLDYRPYGGPSGTGDIDAAKTEMTQSEYDADDDGVCDAAVCEDVPAVFGSPELEDTIGDDLAQIGITIVDAGFDPFEATTDPEVKAALYVPHGWGRDYLSASNFFVGQFYSPVAISEGGNASMVGATTEQLADWGYDVTDVPNVDARIEACIPLTGAAQFECWAGLDQYMMENVASFVPLGEGVAPILASSRVTDYSWDELAVAPSYDRIVLAPQTAGGPASPGSNPVSAAPTTQSAPATTAIDSELEGLWETGELTRETMADTLAAADLDEAGVEIIAENEGFEDYVVYQVEIGDGRWKIYPFPDGEPAGVGWSGSYEVVDHDTVVATDSQEGCIVTYGYAVSGNQLTVDLIDDPCGGDDSFFQTVIYESTPFTRVE